MHVKLKTAEAIKEMTWSKAGLELALAQVDSLNGIKGQFVPCLPVSHGITILGKHLMKSGLAPEKINHPEKINQHSRYIFNSLIFEICEKMPRHDEDEPGYQPTGDAWVDVDDTWFDVDDKTPELFELFPEGDKESKPVLIQVEGDNHVIIEAIYVEAEDYNFWYSPYNSEDIEVKVVAWRKKPEPFVKGEI